MAREKRKINFGGRPPKYKTAPELQKKIVEYLEDTNNKPYTITGLVLFLGFESRTAFYAYEKIDKFKYTIKRARTYIESSYEEQLASGGGAGCIFALKNMGWVDKTEQEVTATVQKVGMGDLYKELG